MYTMPQGRVIKGSLKLKLILSVCITIAFLIGLLTYLIVNIQTDAMLKKTRDSNRMMSQMFYQHLELAMLTGKREEIQRLLQDVGKYEGIITIKIFDETGRIVFCSNPQFIGQKIGLHHTDIFKEENIHGTLDFTEGHEEFHLVTPIKNKNECHRCHGVEKEFMGALDLDISLASMRKAVATNRNVMISFAILTILVVSLVISIFTMKFVSHPVTHLMGTMQEVEKGNLDRRVNLATNDELGMLGESFNSMISKLDEAKKELQVLHESELARADRLASIGELASGIAHEIKNPLAGIGAAIQVISEGIAKDDPQKEVLDEIMKQIERLNKTIKDFLAYARPTEPRMAIYDITDVAKKAVFLIRKQAENQKGWVPTALQSSVGKASRGVLAERELFKLLAVVLREGCHPRTAPAVRRDLGEGEGLRVRRTGTEVSHRPGVGNVREHGRGARRTGGPSRPTRAVQPCPRRSRRSA